jgi:hypothetical protein
MALFGKKSNGVQPSTSQDGAPSYMIEAREVVKTYDTGTNKIQALRAVDFAVAQG